MGPNQDISIATEDERTEVVRTVLEQILEQERLATGAQNPAVALPCMRPDVQPPKHHTVQARCPNLDQFCFWKWTLLENASNLNLPVNL